MTNSLIQNNEMRFCYKSGIKISDSMKRNGFKSNQRESFSFNNWPTPITKSKALPIYENNSDQMRNIPINISNKDKEKLKKEKKAEICYVMLLHDPPIVGIKLKAVIYIIGENGERIFCNDFYNYSINWSRGVRRICCYKDCNKCANLQCLTCAKLKISQRTSYFCSEEHFKLAWDSHKIIHQMKQENRLLQWNENDGNYHLDPQDSSPRQKLIRSSAAFQCTINANDYEIGKSQHGNLESAKALCQFYPPQADIIWSGCSINLSFIPKEDDIGRQIMAECQLYDLNTNNKVGCKARVWTSPVQPKFKLLPKRSFVPCGDSPKFSKIGSFRVMTFNVLADIYATQKAYNYVQERFLKWKYRYRYILDEIDRYDCDIVCLQEVQYSHFHEFMRDLSRLGYDGIFKKKTRFSSYKDPRAVDGCAILFQLKRFALVERFTIEFNEAADGLFRNRSVSWEEIVRRLTRDNVAAVCLLEERSTGRRVCIANTHLYWDPTCADVKLWQTLMLCNELQNLLKSGGNIPLVIAGDFNSMPNSAVYELLTRGSVSADHSIFQQDQLCIFDKNNIKHELKLESAYKAVLGKEPSFTNYTASFKGCIDYILFSKELLKTVGVVEVYGESVVKEHEALPSPRFASDHIQLVAEFTYANV